jgi:glycosyltransferase involved in cell wall biosynthesis
VVISLAPGGLEKLVIELIRRADPCAVSPALVCTDGPGALRDAVPPETPFFACDMAPGLDWTGILRLGRHFRALRAEVVHSHNQRAHLVATLAGAIARVPVSLTTRHGDHVYSRRRRDAWRRRWLAARTDAVVSVSSSAREVAISIDGIPPRKVVTILNGTDLDAPRYPRDVARQILGIPDEAIAVGGLGRLSSEKHFALLIEAVARARQTLGALQAVVLGDGPLARSLRAETAAWGLSGSMRFVGYRADATALLPAFDVVVQSSRSEGVPLALLEAMAAGVPVIATRVGGTDDVVGQDGYAGILVPPGNPVALAEAIVRLLQQPAKGAAMARAARERVVRDFSLVHMVRQYEALYARLARQSGIRP